jgi:hypothetical protein
MPTWEKRRSRVAEVAGHPRYWRAITLRLWLGNFFAFFSITPPPLSLLLFPEPTVVQVLFKDSSVVLLLLLTLTTLFSP